MVAILCWSLRILCLWCVLSHSGSQSLNHVLWQAAQTTTCCRKPKGKIRGVAFIRSHGVLDLVSAQQPLVGCKQTSTSPPPSYLEPSVSHSMPASCSSFLAKSEQKTILPFRGERCLLTLANLV